MKKGITVFRWISASIFLITAIGAFGNKGYLGAFLLALGGIIILPLNPIVKIRNKLNLKKAFTIILSCILFFVGVIVTPTTDIKTKFTNSTTKTVDSETNDANIEYNSSDVSETTTKAISSANFSTQEADTSSQSNVEVKSNDKPIGKSETPENSTSTENKTTTNSATNKQSNSSVQQATDNAYSNNKNSQTVYITKTGKKYHLRKNCPGLVNANSITESTLSEAQSMGLTPCSKCH